MAQVIFSECQNYSLVFKTKFDLKNWTSGIFIKLEKSLKVAKEGEFILYLQPKKQIIQHMREGNNK